MALKQPEQPIKGVDGHEVVWPRRRGLRTKAIHLVEFQRFAESMIFILLIVITMLNIFVIMTIILTTAVEFVARRPTLTAPSHTSASS